MQQGKYDRLQNSNLLFVFLRLLEQINNKTQLYWAVQQNHPIF